MTHLGSVATAGPRNAEWLGVAPPLQFWFLDVTGRGVRTSGVKEDATGVVAPTRSHLTDEGRHLRRNSDAQVREGRTTFPATAVWTLTNRSEAACKGVHTLCEGSRTRGRH